MGKIGVADTERCIFQVEQIGINAGFDALRLGNSLLPPLWSTQKEISQPRKSTAVSDATQRLLQPFPNLFSFQLMSSI